MSHEVIRINNTKYAYYIEGGTFGIVEENLHGHYVSPSANITNGLLVRYTKMPTMPTSETVDVPVSQELAVALVDYVKAKFFERNGEYEKRNFHMREFKHRVMQFNKNKSGGAKIVMHASGYAIR